MNADQRFERAVTAWIARTRYDGDETGITEASVEVSTDACDTCGVWGEVTVWWRHHGRSDTYSISPDRLGAWVGELL